MALSEKVLSKINVLKKALDAEYRHEKQDAIDQAKQLPLSVLIEQGKCWYPVMIKRVDYNRAEYVVIEIERPNATTLSHRFTVGRKVRVFSKQDESYFVEGNVSKAGQHTLSVTTRLDEPPDWLNEGKTGVHVLHDDFTFREAEKALNIIADPQKKETRQHLELFYGETPAQEIFPNKTFQPLVSLNAVQNEAVKRITETEDVFLVHGPPGTGKSTTLAHVISVLLQTEKQILFSAASNTAVDVMTEKLMGLGVKVLRVGNPIKISPATIHASLEYQLLHHENFKLIKDLKRTADELHRMAGKYKRVFGKEEREHRKLIYTEAKKAAKDAVEMEEQIEKYLVDSAQVICCTPAMVNDGYLASKQFNYLFFDEATQVTDPVFWIAGLKAKKIILAGDHFQLGPTVKSDEAKNLGLETSIFEKGIQQKIPSVMLSVQYRMHEDIMAYSNQQFYANGLRAYEEVAKHNLETKSDWDKPIMFIDTAGSGFEEKQDEKTLSLLNVEEAGFCNRYLRELLQHAGNIHSAGVITPYNAQAMLLKQLLSDLEDVTVSTVDGFQGQEKDIILISCVRSNTEGEIGFLRDTRRMNVALTRARKKLVIIGDSSTLSSFKFYDELISFCQGIEGYATVWEFPEMMEN